MNIWRRSLVTNEEPGPGPTPVPPWDTSKLVFSNYSAFSRKVVDNKDVSSNFTERYFCDGNLPRYGKYKKVFTAYDENDNLLISTASVAGVSRVYPFGTGSSKYDYNVYYDEHSTRYTEGNEVCFYCIYYVTPVLGADISYFSIIDALTKNRFYSNVPSTIPTPVEAEKPVIYYKNGIYRGTKEKVSTSPITNENTLINGFKIGNTSTLYNIQGPFQIYSDDLVYPIINMASRPWNYTPMKHGVIETASVQRGSSVVKPAYVVHNNIRYYPSYYVNSLPFAPVRVISGGGSNNYVKGIIIASTNFHINDYLIETII